MNVTECSLSPRGEDGGVGEGASFEPVSVGRVLDAATFHLKL
jgi:hypothetical protein